MNILTSLGRGLFALLFKVLLPLLAVVTAIVMVIGSPGTLKSALRTSGIYTAGTSHITKQVATDTSNNKDTFNDPAQQAAIQSAAAKAISPSFLQSTSEQILDGVYGWLDQKTPQPQFSIDISGAKQQFTQALGDYAVNRAQSLPACTLAQTRQLAGSDIDPLTAPCVPRGFDINTLRGQVADQINKQGSDGKDNILAKSTITPDSLPKDDQGKTPVQNVAENAKQLPQAFHWLKLAPWILGGLALVSAGIVWLLYEDKRRGLRNLSLILTIEGVILLLIAVISMVIFNRLEAQSGPLAKAINNDMEQPILRLVHVLSNHFNRSLLMFAIVYVILGAGTLLALHFTKPKKPSLEETAQSETATATSEVEPAKEATETHTETKK